MSSENTTYRERLRKELALRSARNPKYSLRAFARDLGVFPSRLSDILNEKQGISLETAASLARKLGLFDAEHAIFLLSAEAEHSRSGKRRRAAKKELEKSEADREYQVFQEELFDVVSDWYHFPILELTLLSDFDPRPQWIAPKLGISLATAEVAVKRLLTVGLIEGTTAKWKAVTTFPSVVRNVPSEAVKRFHAQILDKAKASLYLTNVAERDMSAVTMAFDPQDLPKVREEIQKFRRSLERRYKKSPDKRAVYCFSQQFFPLTQRDKE